MRILTNSDKLEDVDYREGAVLLIDKPLKWTSFDVVNKIRHTLRHLYKIKKLKVGHNGTLDPLATGLLMIFTGKYTKLIPQYDGLDKGYSGSFKMGATTISLDAEHPEEDIQPIDHITEESIELARKSFLGETMQEVPIFSAVKQNGQALYKLARKGKKVKPKSRLVNISEFNIHEINLPYINFDLRCSKGTYVRSLARDMGKELKTSAYLHNLKRTSIGNFLIKDALQVDEFCTTLNTVST